MNRTCRKILLSTLSPRHLKQVREQMIREGLSRVTINMFVRRIRRAVKWAVGEELCPASVLVGLQAVPDLKKGRTSVPETEPVRPVPEKLLDAIRLHVSPMV
jgi:hypothetical protein